MFAPADRAERRQLHRAFWLLSAAGALLVVALATVTRADPDLWFHLRIGQDVLDTHHLSSGDLYSFTQDRPFLNHEWLSETTMALAYLTGGTVGLVLLKALLVVTALAVIWPALRGIDFPARLVVLGVLALGTGRMMKTIRPQLWSLVCQAILCRVLVEERPKARRWLPLLFAVWANVHGGWPLGLGVLGLWAAASVWADPGAAFEWAAVVAACVIGTWCTPHGWALWGVLRDIVGANYSITEWQPLWTTPVAAWLPWLVAAAATVWAARLGQGNRLGRTVVLGLLAYNSLRVERVTPFFVTSAVLLLAPLVKDRWPSRPLSAERRHELPFAVSTFVAAVITSGWIASSSLRCIAIDQSWAPDRDVVPLLNTATAGRLVTFFDWGEYAIWHWGPRLRVSIDGRAPAYSSARFAEYRTIRDGTPEGLKVLQAWRAEYVWLPARSAGTKRWLSENGYRIEHDSVRSFLGVRDDLPPLTTFGTLSTPGCFPD